MMKKVIKRIFDSVHGFIELNEKEAELIDSRPFQRLRFIRQLGAAFYVYPGGVHNRFEHSIGVMEMASRIFDTVVAKISPLDIPDHLEYWRQVLRLAALCHDLGHLPFSHVAEPKVLGKNGHELWSLKMILSDEISSIIFRIGREFGKPKMIEDVIKVAIGPKKLPTCDSPYSKLTFDPWDRVIADMITSDHFGADRIDYLLRDAHCTGVSYGLFDSAQLIGMLRLLTIETPNEDSYILGIEEDGIESAESLLVARHFMRKRVYCYPKVRAFTFHLSSFIAQSYQAELVKEDLKFYMSLTDNEVLTMQKKVVDDPKHPAYKHARALSDRAYRYRAFSLAYELNEQTFQSICAKTQVPSQDAGWEADHWMGSGEKLDFPVLKRTGEIVAASTLSQIHIVPKTYSWIYVAPTWAETLIRSETSLRAEN